jgi:hypothetical protein
LPISRPFRTLVLVCVACSMAVLWPHAREPRPLRLRFESNPSVPEAVRDSALSEAARIWAHYGVAVDAQSAACAFNTERTLSATAAVSAPTAVSGPNTNASNAPTGSSALRALTGDSVLVVFDEDPAADETGDSLGAIRFTADGVPIPTVNIHYGTVTRLVLNAPINGLDPRQWPTNRQNEVAGRALGRALAHELGHYLLRWKHHAESGLMRASFHPSSLADEDDGAFGLTANDRARFEIVTAATPELTLAQCNAGL